MLHITHTEALDFMLNEEIDYIIPGIKTVVSTDEGFSLEVVLTTERVR